MKTSLIKINIGDPVRDKEGDRGIVKDISLTPNGMGDPKIICLLVVAMDDKNKVVSNVSENWFPMDDYEYEEFYPSMNLSKFAK